MRRLGGGAMAPSSAPSGAPSGSERWANEINPLEQSLARGRHPRTKDNDPSADRALVLARARGRSPTRWGPAGERRLSVATRPAWRSASGFPDTTLQTRNRMMDPFSDINSYAARQGMTGARPLDVKGMNGARPVQQWKEMLRGGAA